MIAALPMYDRPEIAAATDRLWRAIRDRLRERGQRAPDALTRDADLWAQWEAPDLVLGQTCGLPYRARLHGRVSLVGAPILGLPDCPEGHYFSVLVTRRGAALPAAPRLAVNDALSQSGWANLATWLAATGTAVGPVTLTGAHRASARAVLDGTADLAALDAQSWRLMQVHDGVVAGLDVIDRTPPVPGLPYIAARGSDAGVLADAMDQAIAALDAADRAALNLRGLARLAPADYTRLPMPPPLPAPADR